MKKINKVALIAALQKETGLSKKDVEKAITGLVKVISDNLKEGNQVVVQNLGSFSSKIIAGKNKELPRNKGTIYVEEHRKVNFSFFDSFKDPIKEL